VIRAAAVSIVNGSRNCRKLSRELAARIESRRKSINITGQAIVLFTKKHEKRKQMHPLIRRIFYRAFSTYGKGRYLLATIIFIIALLLTCITHPAKRSYKTERPEFPSIDISTYPIFTLPSETGTTDNGTMDNDSISKHFARRSEPDHQDNQ